MACVASPPLATVPSAVGSIIAQDALASGVATLPSATFAASAGFPAARITPPVPTNATYIARIPAKRTIKTIALIAIATRACASPPIPPSVCEHGTTRTTPFRWTFHQPVPRK